MSDRPLPSADVLARLVSKVTGTMCGITFEPSNEHNPSPDLCWRVATLPIKGSRPLRVAMCSTEQAGKALGAALFQCTPSDLDQTMVDDALRELLNMAAGQISAVMKLDQALGLPEIIPGAHIPEKIQRAIAEGVVLRSAGDLGLVIWVAEDRP
jgi:hypothetical protein